jgi:hypothetical protein
MLLACNSLELELPLADNELIAGAISVRRLRQIGAGAS